MSKEESDMRQPTYHFSSTMTSLRDNSKQKGSKGTTFFSDAFDCARRSWHFKLDIQSNEDLGLWVVERGIPVGSDLLTANPLAPNFSSVSLEF